MARQLRINRARPSVTGGLFDIIVLQGRVRGRDGLTRARIGLFRNSRPISIGKRQPSGQDAVNLGNPVQEE
jgi:hypothetical protein